MKNPKDDLTTCEKGDIGVLMVSANLIKQGVSVFYPHEDSAAYDIIGKYEGKYYEIQVKYRAIDQKNGGKIALSPRRTNVRSKGDALQNNYVINKQFDILAVYCPDLPKDEDIAYILPDKYGEHLSLRVDPPANNIKTMNNKKLLFFKDHLKFDNLFDEETTRSREKLTRFNRSGQKVNFTISTFMYFSKTENKKVKRFRVISCRSKLIDTKKIDKQFHSHKEAISFINQWEKSEAELKLRNA